MSDISRRAFDAMSQMNGTRNPDMTKERRDAIYAALHELERLEDAAPRYTQTKPLGMVAMTPAGMCR